MKKLMDICSFQLIEDSLLWLLASSRWQRSAHKVAQHWKSFPSFVIKYIIPRSIAKYTWAQGTGRHTEEEQFKIFVADIRAISDYLADKPYLMGGKVSEIDCSLFGMMIQFTYHDFEGKFNDYIEKNCENVKDYVERMKQEFWSDWPL
jgi:glutathione S-transferase